MRWRLSSIGPGTCSSAAGRWSRRNRTERLRAMLSPELAGALGSSDWLSLRFGAGAGADDESEWLERLGRLLPADARVIGARLRHPRPAPPIDAGAVLDRHLAIHNGIYRLLGDGQADGALLLFQLPIHHRIRRDEPGDMDGLPERIGPLLDLPAGIAAACGARTIWRTIPRLLCRAKN